MIKVYDIEVLQKAYGQNEKLSEIKEQMLKIRPYKCPCCNGEGIISTYMFTGVEEEWVYLVCEECEGYGFTAKALKKQE